jgi:hypothetical protein
MSYSTTNTRVTRNSITDFTIGVNEMYPAVHYVDSLDTDKQVLVYCPEGLIKFGLKIEFTIIVLKWAPELGQWIQSPYTSAFSVGRMLVDNATYVDTQTGLPLDPQPVDDPNTPQDELAGFVGEYDFWEMVMGGPIIGAIQAGITRRLVL